MDESTNVTNNRDELGSTRNRGSQSRDGSLLNTGRETGESNVLAWARVPVQEIVSTVDRETSAVEPVTGVERVDGETLDSPPDLLGVASREGGNPRGLRVIVVVVWCLGTNVVGRWVAEAEDLSPGCTTVGRTENANMMSVM